MRIDFTDSPGAGSRAEGSARAASGGAAADSGFPDLLARTRDSAAAGLGPAAPDAGADAREAARRLEREAAARAERAAAAHAANDALRKALEDYLSKSPAEHMREMILARMGLSEESLKSMPPEQRAAVEAEIGRRIREWLLREEKDAEPGADPAAAGAPVTDGAAVAGSRGDSPAGMPAFMALQAALAGGGTR